MTMEQQSTVETYESLAHLIEQVMLRPDLSSESIHEGCRIAREYSVAAVLVRPCDAATVLRWLEGSRVEVAAAVGYPYGYSTTAAKLYEGRDMLRVGVKEIDFTLNASTLISRQFQHVETELTQMATSCQESGAVLKVVLNNRFLADDLKIIATKIAKRVGAQMISIDYREPDTALLKPLLKDVVKLKCAGPVEDLATALAVRAAGFARIGSSNTAALLDAWKKHLADQAVQPSAHAQAIPS